MVFNPAGVRPPTIINKLKMKTILAFYILSFLSLAATAQNFSYEFQNNASLDASYYAVENHNTGYSIGFTAVDDVSNDFRKTAKLITTDLNGIIQNTRIYASADADYSIGCSQIISLADGTRIISGNYSVNNAPPYLPYVMRLNLDGSVAWAKKINTNRYNIPEIEILSDSTILLIFSYANPTTHNIYCKLDVNGNFSSFNEFSIQFEHPIQIKPNNNSTFDILTATGNLMNISNDLSTINWQRKYFHEIGITFNTTSNGDYIFAAAQVAFPGYMTIFRTDASGNLIWAKYLEAWEGEVQSQIYIFDIVSFHFIEEDSDGNIIISANSEGALDGFLNVVLDSDGNYISNYKINTYRNKLKVLDNNQYLAVNFVNSGNYNSGNIVFEKRDLTSVFQCDSIYSHFFSTGNEMRLTPDTATLTPIPDLTLENLNIVMSTETISQSIFCDMAVSTNENRLTTNQVTVYPNPSKDKLWIESNHNITKVEIYNYFGKLLQSSVLPFVDVSGFLDGMYFLKIRIENNNTVVKKVIKN